MKTMAAELAVRLTGPWCDIHGHLPYLRDLVMTAPPPVTVIELGVRAGNSTAAFLAGLEVTGGTLWSIDVDPPQVPPGWHDLPTWRFLQAADLSPRALAWAPPQCDVLFIDTSHDAEHTHAELCAYVPRVRPGGLAACHDTHWAPGDVELPGADGPVAAALTRFCAGRGLTWTDRPGWYGLGVFRLPAP